MKGTTVRTIRLAMLQLALVAMVARALVPAGWMPNPAGAASGTPLIICTGQGLVTVRLGPDGSPVKQAPAKDHGQAHDHDICPFAAAAHLAPPTLLAALPVQAAFASGAPAVPLQGRVRATEPRRNHPPRAPPRLT